MSIASIAAFCLSALKGRALVVIVLALGLVVDLVSVPWVLAAMFSLGVSDVFSNTTSGTLLPMLVENDDLGLANSRL